MLDRLFELADELKKACLELDVEIRELQEAINNYHKDITEE